MVEAKKHYVTGKEREYIEGYGDRLKNYVISSRAILATRERFEMTYVERDIFIHSIVMGRDFTLTEMALSVYGKRYKSSYSSIRKGMERLCLKGLLRCRKEKVINKVINEHGMSRFIGHTAARYEITRIGYEVFEAIFKEMDRVEVYNLNDVGKHYDSVQGLRKRNSGVK